MNLINRKAVRAYALLVSQRHRAGKFTRVSAAFLEKINTQVRATVEWDVTRHPSVGKTLK